MQKMNIIPKTVFEKLKFKNSAIWLVESILAYNLRSRFSPDMQFSQNDIANFGAPFKTQKVMLLLLKCQICLPYPNTDNKLNFLKSSFLEYMAKYPHAKN